MIAAPGLDKEEYAEWRPGDGGNLWLLIDSLTPTMRRLALRNRRVKDLWNCNDDVAGASIERSVDDPARHAHPEAVQAG